MAVEKLVLKEALGLLKRNPAMFRRHVIGAYAISLKDYEAGSIGRSSYFLFRDLDDVLDGDLQLEDPLAYVSSIRSQIETGVFTKKPEIAQLAEYSLSALGRKARPDDNPRQDFLDLIDVMIFDNQRSRERRALSSKQLGEYYRQTFFPLHNIMLIGLGSRMRANDIPEMSLCQGRVYSIRDGEADWKKGIINIPADILHDAGLTINSEYREVVSSSVVKEYFQIELRESKLDLERLQVKLAPISEGLTLRIYNSLIKSMSRFIDANLSSSDGRS